MGEEVIVDHRSVARADVTLSCRILGREHVSRLALGHVSARVEHDQILIKGRGLEEEALEFVAERDVITLDSEGTKIDGVDGLAPPAETPIHTSIYRARPEVGSVIHVHPRWVVALAAARKELLPLYGAYDPSGLQLARGDCAYFSSSVLISTRELGDRVAKTLGDKPACILQGHGIVTVGRDVEEATWFALALFELAKVNWMAYSVGEPVPITDEEVESFSRMWEPRSLPPKRADGDTFLWHYYKKKLAESDFGGFEKE